MNFGFDSEPFEYFTSSGFKSVAVTLQDDVLKLGVTLAVEALFGMGEDGLFFGPGLP